MAGMSTIFINVAAGKNAAKLSCILKKNIHFGLGKLSPAMSHGHVVTVTQRISAKSVITILKKSKRVSMLIKTIIMTMKDFPHFVLKSGNKSEILTL